VVFKFPGHHIHDARDQHDEKANGKALPKLMYPPPTFSRYERMPKKPTEMRAPSSCSRRSRPVETYASTKQNGQQHQTGQNGARDQAEGQNYLLHIYIRTPELDVGSNCGRQTYACELSVVVILSGDLGFKNKIILRGIADRVRESDPSPFQSGLPACGVSR
jgi:hypothetical protein